MKQTNDHKSIQVNQAINQYAVRLLSGSLQACPQAPPALVKGVDWQPYDILAAGRCPVDPAA